MGLRQLIIIFCLLLPAADILASDTIATDTVVSKLPIYKRGVIGKVYHYFADANKEKPLDKFDFSIIGGPFYDKTTGFGIGLCGAGVYHMQPSNPELKRSSISLTGKASLKAMFSLELKGLNYFPNDKYRMQYEVTATTFKNEFWGLGYNNAIHNDNSSFFYRNSLLFKGNFLFRLAKDTYFGPAVYYQFHDCSKPDAKAKTLLVDEGGARLARRTSTQAVGVQFQYDSRDIATCATRGIFVNLTQLAAPAFMGNNTNFSKSEVELRGYTPTWKGCVLAAEVHGLINCGHDIDWSEYAIMGGGMRMRGSYEGRYRDRNIVEGQVELRQMVWQRIGVAVWSGCANLFRDQQDFRWRHTVPNYGAGVRWQFKKGMNIRLDFGMTNKEKGFVFNINEAF